MRIGFAQINSELASFQKNFEKILADIKAAHAAGCELIVFPEAVLFGYHPFDLFEYSELVKIQEKWLGKLSRQVPHGIAVVLGAFLQNTKSRGRPFFNSAVIIERGRTLRAVHKQLLPTGDVFDEARYIEPGTLEKNLVKINGKKVFITICEDIWAWPEAGGRSPYIENPLISARKKIGKVDLVLNLSASPFYFGKRKIRQGLVAKTAKLFGAPMVYCNLVGGQDEIIYDGASFVMDSRGRLIAELDSFAEDLGFVDLEDLPPLRVASQESAACAQKNALVLGLRDFCHKAGLSKVHLGLSGGVDSALVAALAVAALGSENVRVFALPTEFSSTESLVLARELANNLGLTLQEISIQQVYRAIKQLVDSAFGISEFSLVHENLQSRIRALILMAHANHQNSMLLSTSNKSEIAAGFSTLYGDQCGGLMPIGDLTKHQVYEMCRLINSEKEVIPRRIIEREPTAELRPNQKDTDRLPPYEDLDLAVENLVSRGKPQQKTTAEKWLLPVLLGTEFKRWQAPPILKISKKSFGRGRRFPIAHQAKKIIGTV